ncbi:unnamed protein product [Protopolystoma xenopodis]|uniref:ACB domain-containing protein n=1 Tax=Protopolystoma xenopodis TaxID=117903 RepID=A0A3S5B9S1_9PLAT|nr:unnamed protein product [Protopolystoma xenopodis]
MGYYSAKFASFDEAKEYVNKLTVEPSNETKLKLYALFKQATIGRNDNQKPSLIDFVGRAKWEAWSQLKDMSKNSASEEYVRLVESLAVPVKKNEKSSLAPTHSDDLGELVTSTRHNGVRIITLNRPEKKNAISLKTWYLFHKRKIEEYL